jgi:hypothetical protein
MKAFKPFAFLFCFFVSLNSIAQTSKAIEDDLYKSFQKIDYWRNHKNDADMHGSDSLESANDIFKVKLKSFTAKYPLTIDQKFALLEKAHLSIATSSDGLFRIYSWDTGEGGSMHNFENVYQYKVNNETISDFKPLDSIEEGHPTYWFSNLYTLKVSDENYYLVVYNGIFSSKYVSQGIKVFAIQNGKLNDNVKLIKTADGLHNQIYFGYDFGSIVYWKVRPSIYFDDSSKTIFIPLVDVNKKMTHKYIAYKFTGQYFERVKN